MNIANGSEQEGVVGNISNICHYAENKYSQTICVKKPTTRYLDEFLNLRCSPDMIDLNEENQNLLVTIKKETKTVRADFSVLSPSSLSSGTRSNFLPRRFDQYASACLESH